MASASAQQPPRKFAVALFPGFQALDVFGPLDMLNLLSETQPLELSLLGPTTAPVATYTKETAGRRIGQQVVPTHTYDTAPDDIEVLLVPGGHGTRDVEGTQPVVDLIRRRFPGLRYLLTVCTGSALAARAGVLDGKRATSNKLSFDFVSRTPIPYIRLLHSPSVHPSPLHPTSANPRGARDAPFSQVAAAGPNVRWVRQARWVEDGTAWTSSGVSAGIDMAVAFIAAHYGDDVADKLAWRSEYTPNKDPANDPFYVPPTTGSG
jgi:transcriptional regulator GlxA family with amidase domain